MTVGLDDPQADRPGRLPDILDALAFASDPTLRGEALLDYSDRFREVPPDVARRPFASTNRIPSCESEAYIWGVLQPDRTLRLYFAVENPSGVSAKALATILDRGLSGLPPSAIAGVTPDLVSEIFRANISMGKGLGLMSMVHAVRTIARQAADYAAAGAPLPQTFPRVPIERPPA